MKIAVTSQNRTTITEHAGRCRKFWVYGIEDQKITRQNLVEIDKEQCFHDSSSQESHSLDDVDVLISAGMGQGLINRLAARGIKGIITKETDPQQAVLSYIQGSLVEVDAVACAHSGCACQH